jgi:arylsulfatase A-like enzyme
VNRAAPGRLVPVARERPTRLRAVRAAVGAGLWGALAGCSGEAPVTRPPDVLVYIADTLRADELGCYGNPVVATPNLDELADEGTRFAHTLAPSSWTRASVGTILTGLPPAVHGAEGRYDLLEDGVVLMSELFQEAGYATANVTTNRNVGAFFGFDQGYSPGGFVELYETAGQEKVLVQELVADADEVTERAVRWIDSVASPFCLVVHSIDPHAPYTPPEGWDRYGRDLDSPVTGRMMSLYALDDDRRPVDEARTRALYRGEVSFNDHAFGELVDHLEARGTWDDTITVFTSDHGEEFWERGERGHGRNVNEKALHVPLILRYPDVVDAGESVGGLTTSADILPTVLELAELPVPEWLEGRSLLDAPDPDRAVRSSLLLRERELRSIRTADWKLIWDVEAGRLRLFDMREADVEVRRVRDRRDVAARLHAELEEDLRRDRELRVELLGAVEAPRVDELPPEVEVELEALGYAGYEGGDER